MQNTESLIKSALLLSLITLCVGCGTRPGPLRPANDQAHLQNLAEEWARSHQYQRISGWDSTPLDLPQVVMSTVQSGRSPTNDLRAYLRQIYAPVQPDIVDESVWCQAFTMVRFIRKKAAEVGITLPKSPQCPAFESWARFKYLHSIEILFATPSPYDPVASFGHTTLRLHYTDPSRSVADDPVYGVIAITGFGDSALKYVLKGLTGGYPLVFEPTTLREISKSYREAQERDLKRYALTLSVTQRQHVLERVWEAERRAYLPYQFFSNNCSSGLAWLLETALFDQVTLPEMDHGAAAPAKVLDKLSATINPVTGLPLISFLPDVLYASPKEAEQWAVFQKKAWDIIDASDLPSPLKTRWQAFTLDDPMSFPALARSIHAHRPALDDQLHLISLATLKIHRAKLNALKATAQHIDFARVILDPEHPLPSVETLLVMRRALYQDEDKARRAALIEERHQWANAIINHKRAPTPAEQQKIDAYHHARDQFQKAARAHHQLRIILGASLKESSDWLQRVKQAQRAKVQATWPAGTHSGQGFHRIGITNRQGDTWGLVYESALWEEALGQKRFHGIGATRELSFLKSEHHIELKPFENRWRGSRLTPFSTAHFDTPIQRALNAYSIVDRVGWSAKSVVLFAPKHQELWFQAGPGLLFKDGRTSHWQIRGSALLKPSLDITKDTVLHTAARFEGAIRYRIYALGSASLHTALTQQISAGFEWDTHQATEWSVRLDLPFTAQELTRLDLRLSQRCVEDELCTWGAQTSLIW